ncbi:MAG: hypothetical protein RI885_702 [Actinomycetota bacterium]|jgi:hypothetical protein
MTRRNRAVIIGVSLLVVAIPLVSGCSVRDIVDDATGGQVQLPTSSVPEDFPSQVPLYDGEVLSGAGLGNTDGKVWNVGIRVPDAGAVTEIGTQLTDAGFETQLEGAANDDGGTVIASTPDFGVAVVVVRDDGGFVANYTVTATPQN